MNFRSAPVLLIAAIALCHAQLPDWDFTTGSLHGWQPNKSLRTPLALAEGLVTALDGTDPWLVGPAISVDAGRARYLRLRLRVGHHGGGSVYFTTTESPTFRQSNMAKFRVAPGGRWQELLLDMGAQPGWQGTITGLRLDPIDIWPNIPAGQRIVVSRITLLPTEAKPAQVSLASFRVGDTWLAKVGQRVDVEARVSNSGGRAASLGAIELGVPDSFDVISQPEGTQQVGVDEQLSLRWQLQAKRPVAGWITVDIATEEGGHLVGARRLFVGDPSPAPGSAVLSHGDSRLLAPGVEEWGYGTLLLQTPDPDGAWGTVAVIPSLGTAFPVMADGTMDGVELMSAAPPRQVREGAVEGWLLEATQRDRDGRLWQAALEIMPNGDDLLLFATRLDVSCQEAAVLRRLDGPTLLMAPVQDEALQGGIVGGLEWLQGAEECWNEAVDRSELRIRYRPHVNRVAVPAMALAQAGAWAGWLWNPGDDPPGVLFGAPTREMTGRTDREMGLCRPGVRDVRDENQDFTNAPVRLEAGQSLTIEGDLVLGAADPDMAEVCRLWIDRFGLPAVLPPPRGSLPGELAFTMQAFLKTLWVEEENGWQNGIGPARNVGRYGPFLASVLMGARWLGEPTGPQCVERLQRTLGPANGFRGLEAPWYEGSLIEAYGRRVGGHLLAMQRQNDDGGWDFDDWLAIRRKQDVDRLHELGAGERSEAGFGALSASQLLRLARVTGDAASGEAGLRAVDWLESLLIPRAAQCWEVPAHAPDIVAAADAIRACIEAYWLTGDAGYREQAESWANRGLPFIYLWADPELPSMLYASTPVLGATWYTGSWYGRPVQWCGLNYAGALSLLIEAGSADPWSTIRDGLLSSGYRQQFTTAGRIALIPDSIDLTLDGLEADYWVPPYQLALTLSHRLGSLATPRTALAGGLRVSAMGQVSAQMQGDQLSAALRFPEPGAHHVLIAGLSGQQEVRVDGKTIPQAAALDGQTAWSADESRGLLEIRLADVAQADIEVVAPEPVQVRLLNP